MILIALAVVAANPATVASVIAAAHPGDTVRLVAGQYPLVKIKSRTFDPPLTIDASAATVAGVQVMSSSGIKWTGGILKGAAGDTSATNYGFLASVSTAITIDGAHITDFKNAIVYDRVAGGQITGNWLARLTADGIDLAAARNIVVARNACSEFTPGPGAHPDCIQAWSTPAYPPVADITITGNSMVGVLQGISLFNSPGAGGFDRMTVTGNTVLTTLGDGITVSDCRGCSVRNNSVNSLPNYVNRAQLYIAGGSVVQCGNSVPMVPRQATPPCKD